MATIRSYTTVEQSRKLAEILPLESADMVLPFRHTKNDEYISEYVVSRNYVEVYNEMMKLPAMDKETISKLMQPCWSLAALLDVLPSNKNVITTISRGGWQMEPIDYLPNVWWCEYEDNVSFTEFNKSADNPVDVCYEMIIKLHKEGLL